ELKVRLRAGRRILDLQSQLISAQEALRDQAARDPLTGIWNRNALFDAFRRELARAERESKPLSIVMADLDYFKNLNDTYGHMAGDAVLREATRRMSLSIRPYDDIGRYGGEEFLIILPGCDQSSGACQAERLRAAVGSEPFDTSEGSIHITCSLGVASTSTPRPADIEALIRNADAALYRAKHNGRNRVEL
ncbi:MAG: GGDEF domain-containing protein, partial [Bryobacteraceae bacterium]